jgi:hypothetical protein
MAFVVREVQPTPNPNAMKFVLDRPVADQPRSFFDADAARGDALAEKLFAIDGVTSVLMLGDFVTVNKRADARWPGVTKAVRRVLEEG